MMKLLPVGLWRRLEFLLSKIGIDKLSYGAQACDSHGIFAGKVAILVQVKMTAWT